MKRSTFLVLLLGIVVGTVPSLVRSAAPGQPTNELILLFTRFQLISLEKSVAGGYRIEVLTQKYIDSFKKANPEYIPAEIVDIGHDFIAVRNPSNRKSPHELKISLRAISEVLLVGDEKPEK